MVKNYGAAIVVAPNHSSPSASSPTPRTHLLARRLSDDSDDIELTAAEQAEYERGLLTWERAKRLSFWMRKEWIAWYALFVTLVLGVTLVAVFHKQASRS